MVQTVRTKSVGPHGPFNTDRTHAIHGFLFGTISYESLEQVAREAHRVATRVKIETLDAVGIFLDSSYGGYQLGDFIIHVEETLTYLEGDIQETVAGKGLESGEWIELPNQAWVRAGDMLYDETGPIGTVNSSTDRHVVITNPDGILIAMRHSDDRWSKISDRQIASDDACGESGGNP